MDAPFVLRSPNSAVLTVSGQLLIVPDIGDPDRTTIKGSPFEQSQGSTL
jgi:hypothetical protein